MRRNEDVAAEVDGDGLCGFWLFGSVGGGRGRRGRGTDEVAADHDVVLDYRFAS